MFSIYDKKTTMFGVPFASPTNGSAERQIQTYVNDNQSPLNKYPEDYDLYFVGDFDLATATITPHKPQHLLNAAQLVNP